MACAFIHHDFDGVETVFLAQRSPKKQFFPGVFEIPGGHIDFGQDTIASLKREVREELCKEIAVGDPFSVFTYINEVKGAHSVEVAFFAEFVGELDGVHLNSDDHIAGSWFSKDEFDMFSVNHVVGAVELAVMRRGFALLRGEPLQSN